jgi:hypothetical protein
MSDRGACQVCTSPDEGSITRSLRDGAAPEQVARKFGVPTDVVRRHAEHLGRSGEPVPMTSRTVLERPF